VGPHLIVGRDRLFGSIQRTFRSCGGAMSRWPVHFHDIGKRHRGSIRTIYLLPA
jgi:hypothetical protein